MVIKGALSSSVKPRKKPRSCHRIHENKLSQRQVCFYVRTEAITVVMGQLEMEYPWKDTEAAEVVGMATIVLSEDSRVETGTS